MKAKQKKEIRENFLKKNKIYFISGLIVILLLIFLVISIPKKQKISSFEDCLNEGNIIENSFPRKCFTKEGKVFTEEIREEVKFERVFFHLKNPIVKDRSANILNDKYSFNEVFEGNFSFDNNSMVVVFDEEKPTAGYSLEIKRIEKKKDRFIVYVEKEIPGRGCFLAQVISHPFDMVKIEKTNLSIVDLVFEEVIYSCQEEKKVFLTK